MKTAKTKALCTALFAALITAFVMPHSAAAAPEGAKKNKQQNVNRELYQTICKNSEHNEKTRVKLNRSAVTKVKNLIAQGANVNTLPLGDWSPLHCAADAGDVRVARILLDAQADVNKKTPNVKLTALHVASAGGYREFVVILIAHGADVNDQDIRGQTPLHWAAKFIPFSGKDRFTDIMRLLVAAGARPDIRDNEGTTALDIARQFRPHDVTNIFGK